jgi:hypothetical protein
MIMKIKFGNRFGRLAGFGLILGFVPGALADPVVFNVNMSVQTALGNFHPGTDTVLLSGNFNNWATNNTMAVSADTNVYTLTQDLAAASWPNYKFVINPNGNSTGTSLIWEVPASFGGGNRYFQVPAGGTNLPAVYFSDISNVPPAQVFITFQLNLAAPIIQGIFSPGSSYVDAFGSWNNWASTGVLLTNVPGTSNYVGTLISTNLSLGTLVDYKYAIDGSGGTWEGNVGTNGTQNRTFTVASTNQTLPLDYWNNITNAYASYPVTFQVDMIVETALGNFNPGNGDTIYVNGDWNWSGDALQLLLSANPYVYTGTVALAFSPGTVINYKYAMDEGIPANSWETNGVGPGAGNNRQFVLQSVATNLPVDYFNNLYNLGPLYISLSGGQPILSWPYGTNANNTIRLQSSTNLLNNGWSDVPNTQGVGAATNSSGSGILFFRLIGP